MKTDTPTSRLGSPTPAILLDPTDGCLTIARSLTRRGVPVRVLATGYFGFVARTHGVRGELLPLLPEGRERWVERLNELAGEGNAVVISGSDWSSEFLVQERERLSPGLRTFERSDGAHLAVMNKAALYELASRVGVRAPWTVRVASPDEVEQVVVDAHCPSIVKPLWSHSGKRLGGYRTRVAGDPAELRELLAGALADGVEMLVTEHVPGGEGRLEAAVTVRSADGSYPLVYARRKVRQYPPDVGVGSMHRSANLPDTVAATKRLLDAAGYEGVAVTEFKRHVQTGEIVLIEVNVRVPRGFGLGDACGADASWRLYATLAGMPLGPQPHTKEGIAAVLPELDLRAIGARRRRGDLSWCELLRSYRGVRDVGVLDLRDPGPARALVGRAVRARLGRRRGGAQEPPA